MALPYSTSNTAGVDFTQSFTPVSSTGSLYGTSGAYSPPFGVGTMVTAKDASQWVYVLFGTGGCTGLGYVMVITSAPLQTAVMTSTAVGAVGDKIGVCPYVAAAGDYGWIQLYGQVDAIQVAASVGANTALASSATAGQLATATGTGTRSISGIVLTTARGGTAGTVPGELNWPVVTVVN